MAKKNRNRSGKRRLLSFSRPENSKQSRVGQLHRLGMEWLEPRRMLTTSPVIISEIAAAGSTLLDRAGNAADWIEITNTSSTQAVNLAGYKLEYNNSSTTTFTFPTMTLGPDEARVIFCDSKLAAATDPVQELNTGFNISKSGKDLELFDNLGNVLSSFAPYPAMTSGESYGVGEIVNETDLLPSGALASYFAPTNNSLGTTWTQPSFNASSWASGPTGLGYSVASGFATTLYKANTGSVASLAQANAVVSTPSEDSSITSETESVLNFMDTGGGGNFGSDNPFPGMTIGEGLSDYVLTATGTITIPTTGYYTFGASSDDGFGMTITGANFFDGSNTTTASGATMASDKLQGPTNTFATTMLTAGTYPVSVTYYQNAGGAEFELFEAPSTSAGTTTFNSATFHLVGDTADGGLAVTSVPFAGTSGSSTSPIAAAIQTNVKPTVQAAIQTAGDTSLYSRITFSAADISALTSLTLRMQYDSGYVAYLNGVEVASSNAPASPTWNSQALEFGTSPTQATTFEDVDLSSFLNSATTGALMATGNVLAIQTLTATPTDQTLFVLPEISSISITQSGLHYFNQPSPGTYNTPNTWLPDLTFSVQHGFYSAPFQLTLTTTTPGATIYYTTDSSTPSATNGTAYTGPITISATTDVRAVSIVDGNAGVISTESYIFLADVINQPADPPGFPTVWGENESGQPQPANYAMNPAITQNPLYAAGLEQDLLSIPTVSLTTDVSNMFSADQDPLNNPGIYSNLDNLNQSNGVSLAVPASFEYFNSSGSINLQTNMTLQIEGGVGRDPEYEVHSFRMEFSGAGLNYPLFSGDAVTNFDNVDLKAGFNDVWSWSGSGNPPGDAAQYMRDIFAANTQLAMGDPSFHSQYVFLYIDGLFWGIYMMDERPDADFAASYLGGSPSQYEANNAGHEVDGSASNLPYWNELQSFPSSNNMNTLASFEEIQGNNPNGTPNPSYTDLLNVPDYIDYMLMNFYIGNTDWPWHNFYAAIDTADPTGFDFFSWDAEMSLGIENGGFNSNVDVNVVFPPGSTTTPVYSGGQGVAELYADMFSNPEFDIAFADQARQFLFDNGALTPAATAARYQAQIDTISQAMVAESARWGDIPTSPGPLPNTQAAWLTTADYIIDTYMPERTNILIAQLQAAGLYPTLDAPEYYVNGVDEYGGTFTPGNQLTMTVGNLPAGGVIYYTLDGTDPRLVGGAVNTASDVFEYTGPITLTAGEEIRARAYSNGTWSAISEAQFTPNLSALRVTELMYDPTAATQSEINAGYTSVDGKEDFEFLEIQNTGSVALPLQGLQITGGVSFTFPNVTIAAGGYMVVVSDQAAFDIRYGAELQSEFGSNWQSEIVAGQYTHHLNNTSDTVELTSPDGGIIQDFTYSGSWYPQTQGGGFSLTVRSDTQALSLWNSSAGWVASGEPGGTPGTGELLSIPLPGSIVINEVLANPIVAGGDMIELYNTTSQAINVGGWWLSDSSTNLTMYQIAANTTIAAYGYLVETDAKNYGPGSGDPGVHTAFTLSPYGYDVFLSSNANGLAGGYQEDQAFGASPLGISAGLLTNSAGDSDFVLLSSPTFGNGPNFTGAANVATAYVSPIVMNELMYDPSQPTAAEAAAGFTDSDDFEFLELYNRSSTTQSLTNYYLGSGVGFTFGWYSDGIAGEDQTLESGATATWSTTALTAGTYTVYADYSLTDQNGNARNTDSDAQYTITYPGGSQTVTIDQGTAVNGKLDLGAITTTGPGQIQVELTRGATAKVSEWTMANQVEFVSTSKDLVVGSPVLNSFSMQSGLTTLAPGAYVVLVSDYAAFNFRYNIAANHIPVAGVYTGNQSNSGELMALYEAGPANATTGFVPYYLTDEVDYSDAAPWPTQAAGQGSSLIRLRPADYGNDPDNWMASNVGGTPGAANIAYDPLPPTVPTNLASTANANSNTISLSWTASTDTRSDVDHYNIYRNGLEIGSSTTNAYTDTTVQSATNYTYTVTAVNRDGVESAQSSSIVAALPGITSYDWIDGNDIEIYFNQPLTAASAGTLANYSITGGTFTGVALSLDDTKVTLTTSTALSSNSSFTITMRNLATASGNQLPSTFQLSGTFLLPTGSILDQVWDNLDGGDAVSDLTNPALNPNYPNNPTYTTYLTSFEAPENTGVDDYGQAVQGYLYAPVTGNYTFWIASDDESDLLLSTNASPTNTVQIADVTSNTGFEQWTAETNQQSASIALVAGQRYYIEALMKQGGGGDNLSVAWSYNSTNNTTTGTTPVVIAGAYLAPYGGNLDLTQPAAPTNLQAKITGTNNQIALSWTPVTDLTSGIQQYVIYRNGQSYGTSTTASFTDTSVSAESLYTYQVAAVNYDGIQGTESAAVSVAPVGIASISTLSTTSVEVVYTEPVDSTSAQIAANYSISSGVSVTAAVLQSDGITVLLTTSTLANSSYTLSINHVFTREGNLLPTLSGTLANVTAGWSLTIYEGNSNVGTLGSVEQAETMIQNPSTDQILPDITATAQVLNYATGNSGGEGNFVPDNPLPISGMTTASNLYDYAIVATGEIFIPAAGTYTFDGNTDDGFSMTIVGANFLSGTNTTSVGGDSFEYDAGRGAADTLGVANFATGGYYPVDLTYFQGTGPSGLEISAAQGTQTAFSSSLFHLIGDTAHGGLAMGGTYAPAPFTVAVNPLTTNQGSPSLSGTVSSSSANVTVRVNGAYYAVTNNNGAWTLPAGDIQPPLANGTYDVLVEASNSAGQTAFDTTTNQLTVNTAGPAVQIASINPSTLTSPLGSVAIQFTEPVNGFGLQNLQLTLNGLSTPLAGATLTTSDNQNWTLGNLAALNVPGGNYQLTLSAAGWGITDNSGTPLTTGSATSWTIVTTAPSAPTNLTATAGNTTATLQWTAAQGATSYNIYRGSASGQETLLQSGITVTSFVDTGLTNGTTYYYQVTAVNTVGESARSSEVTVLPHVLPPSPPTNLTATAGDTTATLQWTAAAGATSYNVYRGTASGQETLLQSGVTTTSFADTGLTDGTTYYYDLTSVNTVGEGARSSEVSVSPHFLPPAPPTDLSATAGNTSATLQWTAAQGATSYNIYRSTASGQETLLHSGVTITSFADTGLTNGQTYYYEVTSVDSGGEGARSSEVSVSPHVLPPAPPTNLSATAGNTSATLQWTGAQGATSYNIYRSTASGQETLLQSGITITSFVNTGLTNGTTYYYEVTSVDSGGEGIRSSEVSVSPHVLPPAPPTNLAAVPGNDQVGLSWTASSGATSYNVYRSSSSGNEVLYHSGVAGTSYTDTGVTNGITYFYQVIAVNGVGSSGLSLQVSATPQLLPAAPTSLKATALNDAQIKIQWMESSTSLTGFQVLRSTNGVNFSLLTTLDPTATSYTDSSNLVAGTTYYYQVVAMNSAGSSNASNTAHAAVTALILPGWTDADIGGPEFAGSASYNSGVTTVSGGGSAIWYSADQFNYFYQSLNGNGTIVAQVLTQGNTNPWAMAGVMIRNSVTSAGSTFADMMITPGNGAAFQYRATANTSNLGNDQTSGAVTDWVKLTRSGLTFTGYVSIDGVNWTEAGSYTFAAGAIGSQIYVGLAVTAFNNSKLSTATFDNVSISGQALPATPTNLTTTALSGTSASLQWQDSDPSIFSYDIYRENPGASNYTQIATVPGSVTNFTDTGLTGGDTYAYQVVAVNTVGDSSAASASVGLPGGGSDALLADPLAVTNANDSGAGSLRQAILNADAQSAATQTITFALPSGSQTIDLLTALPASSVPIVAQLDATQNVTIESASQGTADGESASQAILNSVSTLTTTGAGTLTIAGGIDGAGDLVVAPDSDLTVNSITQNTLTLGAGATLTIAPSGPPMTNSTAVSATDTVTTAADPALDPAVTARLAAVRAERLAAQLAASSTSTSNAAATLAAIATPVAASMTAETSTATSTATSFATPVAVSTAVVTVAPAVASAVAAAPIVASTSSPTTAPTTVPAVTPTVSLSPSISPATAPAATSIATAAAIVSAPAATQLAMGSDTAAVSSSSPLVPLGTGAEEFLNGQNSAGTVDPIGFHEAIDAILADGDGSTSRVDDALLNLLADAAWDRK
jgi:fibronectin type 3 domain-containing protein